MDKRKRIGLAQASTQLQGAASQVRALEVAGCSSVFEDLQAALAVVESGDVLVVVKLDRLARDSTELVDLLHGLERRGVFVQALDGSINTTVERIDPDTLGLLSVLAEAARSPEQEPPQHP